MQDNTFLAFEIFAFVASLKQVTMFTCSLMKCCLMKAYHNSAKPIISGNISSQIEHHNKGEILNYHQL